MKYFNLAATSLFFITFFGTSIAKEPLIIPVGAFSSGILTNWKNKTLSGETNYQLITLENMVVLKAESYSAASGLYKEQRIDLNKTPFLNWSWRIDNRLVGLNEQAKSGDDYSARVYVVINPSWWEFWRTKAINYVWAGNTPKDFIWPNAFAGENVMMIALRSNEAKIQTWYPEKRNILYDLKKQFGSDIQYVDAIAIMTDTDNSKGHTVAYYGDIYFSKK